MEREKAEMALLITLEPPTAPMEQEAVAAGFYEPEAFPGTQFPRVQIATIDDILNGNGPQIPRLGLSEAAHVPSRASPSQGGSGPTADAVGGDWAAWAPAFAGDSKRGGRFGGVVWGIRGWAVGWSIEALDSSLRPE